jgi:hypothetical protein
MAYNSPRCTSCNGTGRDGSSIDGAEDCRRCGGDGLEPHDGRRQCAACGKYREYLEEYYSFGVYAGRYCDDRCWRASGYRDAVDPNARFDPADAGERLEQEERYPGDEGW